MVICPTFRTTSRCRFVCGRTESPGSIQYRSELFRRETIERFISHFFTALDAALANIDGKISDLSILTPAEQ